MLLPHYYPGNHVNANVGLFGKKELKEWFGVICIMVILLHFMNQSPWYYHLIRHHSTTAEYFSQGMRDLI